jgi:hypothetical protein
LNRIHEPEKIAGYSGKYPSLPAIQWFSVCRFRTAFTLQITAKFGIDNTEITSPVVSIQWDEVHFFKMAEPNAVQISDFLAVRLPFQHIQTNRPLNQLRIFDTHIR